MPVSPLPFPRSPQDDAFIGRRGGARGAERTSGSANSADVGSEVASAAEATTPAMLADEGRGPVNHLHETREQAARLGVQLEQAQDAGEGLAQVQTLVAQLGDLAVVGLDRAMPPAQRAALQRHLDQKLREIDTIAGETLVDDRMLRGRFVADATGEPAPFRGIGTAALGLDGLAVRSPDQALAASTALDLAATRLQRGSRMLVSATDRLQDALIGLTSPTTTATGEPALGSASTALGQSMLLRNQLLGSPDASAQAQSGLDAARVSRLLDASSR